MPKQSSYEEIKEPSFSLNTDQAITRVGGAGCYQIIASIILILTFSLTGQFIYILSFLQDRENITIICSTYNKGQAYCDREQACNTNITASFRFDTEEGRTNFITEVPELLCYSGSKMSLQGTLFFIGYLVGSSLWMRLTDYWGRKWMILLGLILHILILLVFVAPMRVQTIYVVMFFLGFKASLTVSLSYILLLEIVSPNLRAIFNAVLGSFDSLSTLCLPFFFEYAKKWRYLYWENLGLAALLILPHVLLVKESPNFLVSRRRFGQAKAVYTHIAKVNKKPMFSNLLEGEEVLPSSQPEQVQNSLLSLLKNRTLRRPLLIIPFLWFSVSMISYGILFSLGILEGSIYINGAMAGVAQVLGAILSGLLATAFGRKPVLISMFLLGGVSCLIYKPITSLGQIASYITILICKFCSNCLFNIVCLITPELFPTVYRGSVFGFGSIAARVGGALAPLLDETCKDQFMYIFGALSIACGLCSCLLHQTKGKVMTDSAEQAERTNMRLQSTEVWKQSYYSEAPSSPPTNNNS